MVWKVWMDSQGLLGRFPPLCVANPWLASHELSELVRAEGKEHAGVCIIRSNDFA